VRRLSLAFWISCLFGASPSRADNTDFHAVATGSVATTDNANGSSTDQRGSVFTDVRPGMLFTYNAPRMIHELTAEVGLFYYLFRDKPDVTARGEWKVFLLTGPRSELSVDASGSYGQVNALVASTPSDQMPLIVQPPGKTNTTNGAASEYGSWVANEFTRLSERGFARYTTTEDTDPNIAVSTNSFEAGGGLAIDHRRRYDNFSFEVGGSYVYLKKDDPFMRQMGNRLDKQLNPRAVGVWAHDWSKEWSSVVDAGVVYVHPTFNLTGDTKDAPFPIFGATVAYTDVWGRAQLVARRQVTPNLFIAENTVADSVTATFAMPLTWFDKDARKRDPKVVGLGTLGVDHTQLIDPGTGDLNGSFWLGRADASVAWQPKPGQTYGARAELTYQTGDMVADMVVPSFHRFTFYFTFALRWPEDVKVRVPRRGNSVRADQGDLAPIGSEPVVVDPSDLLEEGSGER
jgi:hypothetical protein